MNVAEVLTENQKTLLRTFGSSTISQQFYLTGGTALSAFYLQHRYSEDLDFFTNEKQNVELLRKHIVEVLTPISNNLNFIRSLETFIQLHITMSGGEVIKMDFAYDTPFHLKERMLNSDYGIWIDNVLDIACNKISTVFDRGDAKDFVDLYFLLNEYFSFDELWEQAKQKHIGLDEYWFCQALMRVVQLHKLPRMIKPISLDELQTFFKKLHSIILARISS
jgi:predicted nucleotidyltransferase component of viral defense system